MNGLMLKNLIPVNVGSKPVLSAFLNKTQTHKGFDILYYRLQFFFI